ncbi:MAG: type III pantothenate kinase [Planctomycetes bacterium]|nr:type III pantothenate kinase [Planctomycetota bacterium]
MAAAPGLLTIDCGNSTIDLLRHDDGARLLLAADDPAASRLSAFLGGVGTARVMVCSVAQPAFARVEAELAARRLPMLLAGRDFHYPLRLDYETPATLGADRWVGAYAAWRHHGRSVVVDCGSATTVNVVEGDGTFRGGAIAPGLRAWISGMAATTPALPVPRPDGEVQVPALSSQASVDAGLQLGYAGMVERLVESLSAAAGGPARLVVTGGNARHLLRHLRREAVHASGLVHEGLRLLADLP